MLVVITAFGVLYIWLIFIVAKTYYNDTKELEERILILEKRLEEYRREMYALDRETNKGVLCCLEDIHALEDRVEKIERKRKKDISKNS